MISKSIFWISLSMLASDYISQIIYKKLIPSDETVPHNARWFFIHALVNLGICLIGCEDVGYCLKNYEDCSVSQWTYKSRITFQLAVISHLYHILVFFGSLKADEWVHHIVMLFIAGPITMMRPSRVTTVGLFFMTGFPGFIDYTLLWLVKIKKLKPLTEKRLYIWINTWLRSPGCALTCFLAIPALRLADQTERCFLLLQALLTLWNGQYYMMKTCVDYGRKLDILDVEKKNV